MTKLIISDEAARAVVKAGTTLKTKSVQRVPRIQDAPASEEKDDVRPARLQSSWAQNSAGVWHATACFIVNDTVDTSFVFPVYAPTSTGNPGGEAGSSRFFVVWRGRWELMFCLTPNQVQGELAAYLSNLFRTKTLTIPNYFTRDSDGYLTMGSYVQTLRYYGPGGD